MKKRGKDGKSKGGLSPVIATVLLVAMVIVIGLIVFLWIRGLTEEAVTKDFGGGAENIELVCNDVYFDASYSGGFLYISNTGNVPIFGMKVKIYGDGSHSTKDLREDSSSGWPETGLGQGGSYSGSVSLSGEKLVLVPVLLGESDKGKKAFTCSEKQNGYEILI